MSLFGISFIWYKREVESPGASSVGLMIPFVLRFVFVTATSNLPIPSKECVGTYEVNVFNIGIISIINSWMTYSYLNMTHSCV